MEATMFGALAPLILALAVAGPPHRIARQAPDSVELTVSLSSAVSSDEALAGDVDLEFIEAVSREPVVLYIVEAPVGEQTFQVTVPVFDSRSGWFVSARSEGWWSSAAYIAPGDEEVSLTLVPEGVVRFTVDGTDRGVDLGQLVSATGKAGGQLTPLSAARALLAVRMGWRRSAIRSPGRPGGLHCRAPCSSTPGPPRRSANRRN